MKYVKRNNVLLDGIKDGVPIALGYFAVAFSLGIAAKKIGMGPVQGFISSVLNHASAGEYAEFTAISANAPYWEMALIILVANARYLLMSCALSQKFAPETGILHRLLVGFGITDEIFGASIGFEGYLDPLYSYGLMLISIPSWAAGTAIGIVAGNILPNSIVSALSVALYGMFLAIIVPPSRKNKVILGFVFVSFICSYIAEHIEVFSRISGSMRCIILTVAITSVAAILFPHVDEEDGEEGSSFDKIAENESGLKEDNISNEAMRDNTRKDGVSNEAMRDNTRKDGVSNEAMRYDTRKDEE